jgi:hypothetical protein
MRLVEFIVDMRPYRARQKYALPDKVAQSLIDSGAAKQAPGGNGGLQPDAPLAPLPSHPVQVLTHSMKILTRRTGRR